MRPYRVTIGKKYELPLPDDCCKELGIEMGDILAFSKTDNGGLSISKHSDQLLSDTEVASSGYLSRVIKITKST